MGALILGPRIGKYGADGKPRTIPGHSIPFAILGCFILLVGWYGFNPGSWLAADAVIGKIAVNTTLAGGRRRGRGDDHHVAQVRQARRQHDRQRPARRPRRRHRRLLGRRTDRCRRHRRDRRSASSSSRCCSSTGSASTTRSAPSASTASAARSARSRSGCSPTSTPRSRAALSKKGLFYGGGADQLVSQVIGVVVDRGLRRSPPRRSCSSSSRRPSACGSPRRRRSRVSTSTSTDRPATSSTRCRCTDASIDASNA